MRSSNRSPLTDELIIEKLKSNDLSERDEGWIAFDANYRLSIQNLVKSRLQEINAPQRAYLDAEDYTSAVILEVADSIGNYKEGNFHGWVTGITKNVVNTYARKVKNGQKAAAQMQLLIFQQKKAAIPSLELLLSVHNIHPDNVESLSTDEREVLKMLYLQGLSYEEIAQQTGKNEAALRQNKSRGLKKIRFVAEKDRTDYGYALLPLFILRYKVQSQTHYLKFGQLPKNPVAEELANNLATLRQKASLTYEEIANRTQLLEQDHAIALEHGLIFDEDIEPDWVNELGDALGIDPSKLVSPLSEGHEKSLEAEHTSISSRLYTYKWYGMASIILIAIGSLLLVNRFDEVQPVEAGSVISTPIPTSTTNTQELAPPIVYVWTPTQTSLPLANPTYTPSPSATPTLTPEIPPTSLPAQCQVAGTDSSINIWSGPGGRRIDGGEIYSPIGWARSGSVFEIVAETHRGEYFLVSIEQSQVEAGNIRAHIGYKLESLGWVFASSCPRLNEESVPPPMTIPAILTPTPTRTPSPTPTHTASPTPTIVPPQLSIELRNLEWDPQSNSYPIHIIVTANNTSAIEFMTLEYYFDVQSGNRIEDQVTLLQSNSGQYIFEIRRGCGDETVLGYQIKAALINGELITEPNPGNFYTEIYPYCAY